MSLIKYGISSENYVSDWGYQEAVREIVQNFRDYGEFKEEVRFVKESNPSIVYSNDYIPNSLEFLKVGFSKKHSADAVGKYGEGLKLGMMVLHRLGLNPMICFPKDDGFVKLTPTIYEDDDLGSCFGIETEFIEKLDYHEIHEAVSKGYTERLFIENLKGFTILFDNSEHQDTMKDYFLTEEDILFKSDYGSIVDKEAGSIYVGGIFVTKNGSIKDRAYDLKPEHVDMGRDRNFPSSYDLKWTVSYIYRDYLKEFPESFENHSYDEVDYMDTVPIEVTKDINPVVLGGEIKYQYTKTKQVLNSNLDSALIKDERLKKEVEKIKRGFTKRKTPIEMLEAFKENYYYSLSYDGKMDLQNIIDRVKI